MAVTVWSYMISGPYLYLPYYNVVHKMHHFIFLQ